MLCFCALIIDSHTGSMVIKKSPIGISAVAYVVCAFLFKIRFSRKLDYS